MPTVEVFFFFHHEMSALRKSSAKSFFPAFSVQYLARSIVYKEFSGAHGIHTLAFSVGKRIIGLVAFAFALFFSFVLGVLLGKDIDTSLLFYA